MSRRNFRSDTSGQVLIVSALLIALLLLSTAIYVLDVGKTVPTVEEVEGTRFASYRESIRNAVVSALANRTNGETNLLPTNLESLKTVIFDHSYQTMLTMDYTVLNTSPYSDGIWISWGTNGQGVSSAYSSFALGSSGPSGTSNIESTVNITSSVSYTGTYVRLTGNTKQVNLIINIRDEVKPALAQNFTFYGDYDGSLSTVDWVSVNSMVNVNYYNGTYVVSFNFDTAQMTDDVYVSTLCHDQRGIFMVANATCTMG